MNNKVNIFILNTKTMEGENDGILSIIAPLYVQKYEKAKVTNVKKQELGAGFLLSKYLGITKDDQLYFNRYGKPSIKNQQPGHHIEFNLSHSDDYVVLAVSNIPIGIDIECAERLSLPILKRVLPPSHFEKLQKRDYIADSGFEKDEKLVWAKYWTSVEAILKAQGSGFHFDPRKNPDFMNNWSLESFIFENRFVISCASKLPFSINSKIVINSLHE
ncbi:4'-phosphopantetheinyl transferase family protein [Butyrivibrio sp. AE3004]|uniref:4'-phosphopantetheinyl transferase family protein n=1 Tax=Butyrivibrio sp. AE3004 TaxID=1506994 RepID=UPI000A51EF2C|nr:4'-phosphopantetheinyl transferase superfamily protein [Butyrivibrio sp. AE3004]